MPSDSEPTEYESDFRLLSASNKQPNYSTDKKLSDDTGRRSPSVTSRQDLPKHQLDGGWGWVVVFSCFFQNLLVDGTLCSFGVLYVYLIEEFKSTSLQTSCILSAQLSIQALFSPLASALIINFGGRKVMMLGAALMSLGTLSSGFVPDIYYLYITMGVITGMGMSMLSQTASVVISFYFDKRRGLANGISTTGSGLGFFIFPPLATYFLEEVGLRGTCMILSGVMMQGIVCGALIIKSENDPTNSCRKARYSKYGIGSLIQWAHAQSSVLVPSTPDQSGMYLSSIDYYRTHLNLYSNESASRCGRFWYLLKEITKASFDLKLLKNGAFMLYLLGTVLRQLVGYIPSMLIVSRAISFGIRKEDTGFLMSVFGVTNIVGRLLFGFLADVSCIRHRRCYLYGAVSIAAGLVSLFNFGELITHQMIYCSLYGLMYGCTISMKCTVLSDIIGNRICTGFGMIMFAAGFTVFLGPSSAGWLFDYTGSYDAVFAICGAVFIASGLAVMPIICIIRRRPGAEDATTIKGEKKISLEE